MFNFIKENLFLFLILFLIVVAPSFLFGAVQIFVYIILALIIMLIIGGLVIRWKFKNIIKSGQQGYGAQNNSQSYYRYSSRQGEESTYSTTTGATKKKVSDDVGEYVDFEEINK